MARVVDYPVVLESMRGWGFDCLYYNSGAFGLKPGTAAETVAWVGKADPTIRPEALALARQLPPPPPGYEVQLATLAGRVWQKHLGGDVWVLPKSHWAYELEFGNADWLPAALEEVGIDPASLRGRNNGAAVEFAPAERTTFERFVQRLFEALQGSDFLLAFPGRQTLCTVHHNQQLWWTTAETGVAEALREAVK